MMGQLCKFKEEGKRDGRSKSQSKRVDSKSLGGRYKRRAIGKRKKALGKNSLFIKKSRSKINGPDKKQGTYPRAVSTPSHQAKRRFENTQVP